MLAVIKEKYQMKKAGLLILLIFIVTSYSCSQEKQLSTSQKIDDFNYLYSSLKDNYPFFGVNKRQNNVDWLNKKNEYLERIRKTKSDSSFYFALKSIISELNSGHVSFSPTQYYDGYLAAYKKLSIESPRYKKWVEVLESDSIKPRYWAVLISQNAERKSEQKSEKQVKAKSNYTDTIINGRFAVMTIESFNLFSIESDKPRISEFLKSVKELEFLIIDIQNNGGGATSYWKENIVGKIIDKPIVNTTYPIIKDGNKNRFFYQYFFETSEILKNNESLPQIPPELISERYYIKTSTDTIYPNNPIGFKGEIYLLVSEKVFSSSEGFAQFCKTTKWATIAGERTGGDGIGSDPSILRLPESGILVNYPSLIGLNHNGSLNSEERTIPDIEIKGNTSNKRLDKLIEYLKNRK